MSTILITDRKFYPEYGSSYSPAYSSELKGNILEKIRVAFENYEVFFEGNAIHATVSIGMMELNSSDENLNIKDLEDAVSIVDKKLYHAKNEGKNKIV